MAMLPLRARGSGLVGTLIVLDRPVAPSFGDGDEVADNDADPALGER